MGLSSHAQSPLPEEDSHIDQDSTSRSCALCKHAPQTQEGKGRIMLNEKALPLLAVSIAAALSAERDRGWFQARR